MPDFRPCGFVCTTTPARQSEKGLLLDFQGNQRLFADSIASQQFLREEPTHQGAFDDVNGMYEINGVDR